MRLIERLLFFEKNNKKKEVVKTLLKKAKINPKKYEVNRKLRYLM